MTRWLVPVWLFAGLGLLLTAPPTPALADPPKVSPRADTLDLLVLAGEKPLRLELRVEIGGQSVPAIWDQTFTRLLTFHDRNGDGFLDRTEASRLPSAFALRQVLWGQIVPFTGEAPPFADLDQNQDSRVSADELADFYRRAGLGGILVGIGQPVATKKLTEALLKHLDSNKNGKVEENEWKSAAQTLRQLDKNDDELIGPGELVEKTSYPGALGAILLKAPAPQAQADPILDALPLLVLPLRRADTYWMSAVAARRKQENRPPLSEQTLTALLEEPPAASWQVRLDADKARFLVGTSSKPSSDGRLRFWTEGLRLELHAEEGKLKEQTVAARQRYTALFAECDTNFDKVLEPKELSLPKAGQFAQLLRLADRDDDGNLTEKELTAWLDLQEQVARGHIFLSLRDHGSGLFELLDADHDGSLSVRELRTAWARAQEAGCLTEKGFQHSKLPRQLLASISHGQPRTALGKPNRRGPSWFQAMDRNGDGEVSRREFTGPVEVFGKLDSNKDGLIDADEASQVKSGK